jgi:hypothetical protein
MNLKFAIAAVAVLVGVPTMAAEVAQGSAQSSGRAVAPAQPSLMDLQGKPPALQD